MVPFLEQGTLRGETVQKGGEGWKGRTGEDGEERKEEEEEEKNKRTAPQPISDSGC